MIKNANNMHNFTQKLSSFGKQTQCFVSTLIRSEVFDDKKVENFTINGHRQRCVDTVGPYILQNF
jgi:hypothetical protein